VPGTRVNADLWFTEYVSPWDIYSHGIKNVLVATQTRYQRMYIVETGLYGKALILDGKWQSSTVDEFLYHEPLVHPACILHGDPRRVLILGGGEGATAREALRWKTVEKVLMVDIDGEVVEACREYLPEMHQGAFDDPRAEVLIGDALDYLAKSEASWDIIISDLSDPIEQGPSFKLFTREFFEQCLRRLAPGGVFVVQAGPTSPAEMTLHVRLASTVRAVFPHFMHYVSYVPTYGSPWGFVLGTEREIPLDFDPAQVDRLLAEKTKGGLRMIDGRTMRMLWNPPKYLREAIAAETRVYTLEEPPKFFGQGIAGKEENR